LGILICLNTGLRVGEVCALRWENIDFESRIITVKTKGNKIHTIPIIAPMMDILVKIDRTSEYVFTFDHSNTSTSDYFDNEKEASERLKGKKI
jgi:integrase